MEISILVYICVLFTVFHTDKYFSHSFYVHVVGAAVSSMRTIFIIGVLHIIKKSACACAD